MFWAGVPDELDNVDFVVHVFGIGISFLAVVQRLHQNLVLAPHTRIDKRNKLSEVVVEDCEGFLEQFHGRREWNAFDVMAVAICHLLCFVWFLCVGLHQQSRC